MKGRERLKPSETINVISVFIKNGNKHFLGLYCIPALLLVLKSMNWTAPNI